MAYRKTLLDRLGHLIAGRITKPTSGYEPYAAARPELTAVALRPCDVLLVEGSESKISSAIRYLTQSTWSHAALYLGPSAGLGDRDGEPLVLVEAELGHGVIASPLSKYATYNTRICRPVGLTPDDRAAVIAFAVARIGHAYDLKNIVDLLRYLLPQPPVPTRWRRRMIALGSGEPTRAICSTLIAQAFQSVRYPILPRIERVDDESRLEILHIRHHSLFAPRDFDVSPFFAIVKPTIESGFDYKCFRWGDQAQELSPARVGNDEDGT
ncbi:MAG: lipo-like protein [Pseudorhodoplanes sp.]|nr:MAG: lipo-like protein [Pseudorhodoplanes sp.]